MGFTVYIRFTSIANDPQRCCALINEVMNELLGPGSFYGTLDTISARPGLLVRGSFSRRPHPMEMSEEELELEEEALRICLERMSTILQNDLEIHRIAYTVPERFVQLFRTRQEVHVHASRHNL